MKQRYTEFTELIPGLPEEIALECLTRLHYSAHSTGTRVCRRWCELLKSRDFYYHRKKLGHTRRIACLVQSQSVVIESDSEGGKSAGLTHPSYGISFFDPVNREWNRVDPIPKYADGFPMFCKVIGSEGKLVVMGGWDPISWEPIKDVFVYEFTTRNWTRGKDMPSTRSFFAIAEFEGRIFVAGGHDENKNALSSAWVYDLKTDEWTELPRMSEDRDECEGVIIGSEFWVVSGYSTDNQGAFKASSESYNIESGQWKQVDDSWIPNQCPSSCVGVDAQMRFTCLAGSDPEIRVGVCGVEIGEQTLVIGSAYQGAKQGIFLKQGQNGKLLKIDAPPEFSGSVQSGCCVEI